MDEYRLMMHPVVVGGGSRLFGDGLNTLTLRLVDTGIFSTGTVVLVYRPDR